MSQSWRICIGLALAAILSIGVGAFQEKKASKTDGQIRQEIIAASIASYGGGCPCPYNTDRAGRRCGRRSAYSRPGGALPMCYEGDVTQKMVDDYRKRAKEPAAKERDQADDGSHSALPLSERVP
jgi:hypothetical protein